MGSSGVSVVIRADASQSIGMGHRVRCSVLADVFKRKGADVRFVTRPDCVYDEADLLIKDEASWLSISSQADIAVVDHYGFDRNMIAQTYESQPNMLVLDDNNNRGALDARWLLNPLTLSYNTSRIQHPFVGPKYALLRPQFAVLKNLNVERRKLLLTFGGSDPLNLTLPFIKSLLRKGFSSNDMLVMVGGLAEQRDLICSLCDERSIEHYVDTSRVASLMSISRYALSAAGGTLFELACMGVPSYFIQVARNQKEALQEHTALGWCTSADFSQGFSDEDVSNVVDGVMLNWNRPTISDQESIARCAVDGVGSSHVVNQMLSNLRDN
ncbi:PseG/SpsG family protein [Marinomonas balearica]|uniref:Spore coat polysaccharide biosynthesis predicted glycosyltransferase SpsG n=1 Tax=Marinomonas balearica TaxID=491947 RepID=A0A4R6M7W8_9GAMM|nr:UDP-2,4-diacetamido-2,4,6-trideoxy-beta-L-altropyranose hydrolase [Marinomonas balearica]TDO96229.1 spore coat polysaccharide biosynthesis predicted glycosyltransferase SpsG [Marinomonas balearica]